jgi:hypothetical protein
MICSTLSKRAREVDTVYLVRISGCYQWLDCHPGASEASGDLRLSHAVRKDLENQRDTIANPPASLDAMRP